MCKKQKGEKLSFLLPFVSQRLMSVSFFLAFFLIFIICSYCYGKEKVNLGLVGKLDRSNLFFCVDFIQDDNTPQGSSTYAYCGTEKGLFILDVSDPRVPKEIVLLDVGKVNDIAFFKSNSDSFNYAVLANSWGGLVIIDISDPTAPSYSGGYFTQGDAQGIVISGNDAYVANGDKGLIIIDISDPTAPSYTGGYDTQGDAKGIAISGNYAYLADGDNGLIITDISNPTSPSYLGKCDTQGDARSVSISGNCTYVADGWDGLVAIDISDPTTPSYLGKYDTQGMHEVQLFPETMHMWLMDGMVSLS